MRGKMNWICRVYGDDNQLRARAALGTTPVDALENAVRMYASAVKVNPERGAVKLTGRPALDCTCVTADSYSAGCPVHDSSERERARLSNLARNRGEKECGPGCSEHHTYGPNCVYFNRGSSGYVDVTEGGTR